jgi:hypothetical protein
VLERKNAIIRVHSNSVPNPYMNEPTITAAIIPLNESFFLRKEGKAIKKEKANPSIKSILS